MPVDNPFDTELQRRSQPVTPDPASQPNPFAAEMGSRGLSETGTPLPPRPEATLTQGPRLAMPEPLQTLDDLTVALMSGLTFETADELKAAIFTALGTRPGLTYDENVEIERNRARGIEERIPVGSTVAKGVGGLVTGGTAAKGGLSLVAGAKPTLASMGGRGAAEGAIYGGIYGAGSGEGVEGKLKGTAEGAVWGFGTGGLTGAFFWPFLRGKTTKPTIEGVKDESTAAFKRAEKAGLEITADSFGSAVDDIAAAAKKAGIDAQIHPKATAALQRLQNEAGENLTLDSLTTLRRVIKGAAASPDPDERRIAMILVDKFDKYAERLLPRDIIAGDRKAAISALTEGRMLWSRYRKGEAIMEAMDRAGVRAGQFSGSGYENALRTEFRAIAMNPRKMRTYTKAEQGTIRKVAMGGPIENAMRMLGKFAPRGIVSATLGGGAGFALGGPAGSAAVMGAGEVGRRAATAITKASAQRSLDQMLSGTGPVTITRKQADLLRSLIIAEQPVAPELLTNPTVRELVGR